MKIDMTSRKVRRGIGLGLLAWAILLLVLLGASMIHKQAAKQSRTSVSTPTQKPAEATVLHVAAMGDMLAHDSVVSGAKTASGYDFTTYFTRIKPLYSDADVVFCNPETPAAGDTLGVSGYPSFNAPSEFPRDLSKTGCNLINLATNHLYDKGQAGVDATIANWRAQKPLALAGANKTAADADTIAYFTKNGIKVAFLAFMDFSNAPIPNDYSVESYHNETKTKAKLARARQTADVVIVSAHWGTEDSTKLNTDQTKTMQLFAEAGVDVVLGTGPHVLQPVTTVKSTSGHTTYVWYSLGNMLSSQLTVNELTGGVARFDIIKKDGYISIEKLGFYPTFMTYDWPAADRAAERLTTRTNLMLYPLPDAADRVKTMFPGETLATRQQFITGALGAETNVVFTAAR